MCKTYLERGKAVANVGHLVHALELAPDPVVDTLGPPPVALQLVVAVALVPRELLRALLDDLRLVRRHDRHLKAVNTGR